MANIEDLYQKFLDRRCSREESEALLRYFREQPDSGEIQALIQAELDRPQDAPDSSEDLTAIERNREALRRRIFDKPQRRINPGTWALVAAIATSFLGLVFYVYLNQINVDPVISQAVHDVKPGTNRAYITLSNGQRLELDSTRNAISAIDGKLSYEDGSELSGTLTEYATINTPVGGEYRLTLPDGTKAWLNAASSLTYPVRFTGKDRTVEIAGEVFLEVTTDKQKPFVVQTGRQRIEVLGTEFNVRNYSDKIITTLVRGRIALSETGSGERVILAPGDQASLSANGIRVTQVNASDFTAWTNGIILNKDASLADMCRELERWYDVRFVFPKDFSNQERALISIDRTEMLSAVLASFEKTYHVQFTIKGKEVLVR